MTRLFLYVLGGGLALISAFALFVMQSFSNILWFAAVFGVWLFILFVADRFLFIKHGRRSILPLLIITSLSVTGLMSVVGWQPLEWLMIIGGGMLIGILFPLALFRDTEIQYGQKLVRRIIMMYWVFGMYGVLTTLFALAIFFRAEAPFWLMSLLGGMLAGLVAWMIWREYVELPFRQATIWIVLVGFVTIEWMWMMYLLPFGYLVAGLLVTWPWYVLQLFLRFHFGRMGIIWSKQRWFLAVNTTLYVLTLMFLVRWV